MPPKASPISDVSRRTFRSSCATPRYISGQLAEGGLRLHPSSLRAIAAMQAKGARPVRVAILIAAAGALGWLAIGLM